MLERFNQQVDETKMGAKQSIAEYLGEFREIQVDWEAAGQSVSDTHVAIHALKGLLKKHEMAKGFLEMGDMGLSLES